MANGDTKGAAAVRDFKKGQAMIGPPENFIAFHSSVGMDEYNIDGLWWATPKGEQDRWLIAGRPPAMQRAAKARVSSRRPLASEGLVLDPLSRNIQLGPGGRAFFNPATGRMEPVPLKRPPAPR